MANIACIETFVGIACRSIHNFFNVGDKVFLLEIKRGLMLCKKTYFMMTVRRGC